MVWLRTGALWLGDGSGTAAAGVGETLAESRDGAVSLGDGLGEILDWTWLGAGSLGDTLGEGAGVPAVQEQSSTGRAAGEADVFSRNPWKNPPFLCLQYRHSRQRGRSKRGEAPGRKMEQKIRVGKKKKPEVFEIKDFGFSAQKEGFEEKQKGNGKYWAPKACAPPCAPPCAIRSGVRSGC